jgi:hypothetical protein
MSRRRHVYTLNLIALLELSITAIKVRKSWLRNLKYTMLSLSALALVALLSLHGSASQPLRKFVGYLVVKTQAD